MVRTPRIFCLMCAAFLAGAAPAFADAVDVPVTFQTTTNTVFGQSVFVVGSIPQLGNWATTNSIKLVPNNCVGSVCTWSVVIGIPPGTAYSYRYLVRSDCAQCYSTTNLISSFATLTTST